MTTDELIQLLDEVVLKQRVESNVLEFKESKQKCSRLYDTLSSFSNQDIGGIILLGVSEHDGSVIGVDNASSIIKQVQHQCEEMFPAVKAVITQVNYQNKSVICIEVPGLSKSERPCYHLAEGVEHGSYFRLGDADKRMASREVYDMQQYAKGECIDIVPIEGTTLKDIQTPELAIHLATLRKENIKLDSFTDKDLCEMCGFTKNGVPTLAGYLLFNNYPQQRYLNFCVKACVVSATSIERTLNSQCRFIDSKRFEGNLFDILKYTESYILQHINNNIQIDKNTGKRVDLLEYPLVAIRETLINALVHRDYSSFSYNSSVMLYIYPDRIELSNPGGVFGGDINDLNSLDSEDRNPHILKAFEDRGLCEARHTGIPLTIAALEEAGLRTDVFSIYKGFFKVTLYKKCNTQKTSIFS